LTTTLSSLNQRRNIASSLRRHHLTLHLLLNLGLLGLLLANLLNLIRTPDDPSRQACCLN
jgi:hypothetical protein